jgi:hypothetical protein
VCPGLALLVLWVGYCCCSSFALQQVCLRCSAVT